MSADATLQAEFNADRDAFIAAWRAKHRPRGYLYNPLWVLRHGHEDMEKLDAQLRRFTIGWMARHGLNVIAFHADGTCDVA